MIYGISYILLGILLTCYGLSCMEGYGAKATWQDIKRTPIWILAWPFFVLAAIDEVAKGVAKKRLKK
jgi:hypothetical protein